jgi:formylglycine-generating enzyme required for sulfatase activity
MVHIPAGTFLMGKAGSRADEAPVHEVSVAAFRAAVAPVSNAEYAAFVAATGAERAPFLADERFAEPEKPAVGIDWFQAVAYCEWLSRETSDHHRLPTEAEREYAALGGLSGTDWPWLGERPSFVGHINSSTAPHIPGPACANGYGLMCMAENVHEWCSDWYSPAYYAESPLQDPRGPADGVRRASRGGAWRHSYKLTRVNARSSLVPTFRYNDYGFRVYEGIAG